MPSDRALGKRIWELLLSQGLGVLCGLATSLLLAVGSVVITVTKNGASARVTMDDLRAFFVAPSPWHAWFYLLMIVLTLYGLNVFFCTLRTAWTRWKIGIRAPTAYGAAVMHLSFLLALIAHLVGGVGGSETAPVAVAKAWTPLGQYAEARLAGLRALRHPNGTTKQVYADIEWRLAGGGDTTHKKTIAYNAPLSRNWGSRLSLLAGVRKQRLAKISDGSTVCAAQPGQTCRFGERLLQLRDVYQDGHWGKRPVALVRELTSGGSRNAFLFLEVEEPLPSGLRLTLLSIGEEPVIILRNRYAPGNPWAMAAALVLVAGMLMFGRRWWSLR